MKLKLQYKDLAIYYSKLKIITQGDIFAKDRIYEIINFNMGRYEYMVEEYKSGESERY